MLKWSRWRSTWYGHKDILDDEHPGSSSRIEQVHGVLVKLVEVEGVDALLGTHQDVLVVRLWVDPRRCAVDAQRTPVENLPNTQLCQVFGNKELA